MQSSSDPVSPHLVDETSWQLCDLQACPHVEDARRERRNKVALQLALAVIASGYALVFAVYIPLAPQIALLPILALPHVCDWLFPEADWG